MLRRPAGVPRLDLRPAFCARDRLGAMVAAERRAASPVGPRLRRHRFSFGEIITTPRSKPRESPAGGRNDNTVSLAEDAFRRYHYDPMRKVPLADDPMYINPALFLINRDRSDEADAAYFNGSVKKYTLRNFSCALSSFSCFWLTSRVSGVGPRTHDTLGFANGSSAL